MQTHKECNEQIKSTSYFLPQELERNIALCSQKLLRAEKLISGLGGERSRWTQVSSNTPKTFPRMSL